MLNDLRYAIRQLFKKPAFTAVASIALMLTIASATVIFSVINGVLLRPLPYPAAERLVTIAPKERATGAVGGGVSPANYLDWSKQSDVFTAIAASSGWQGNLSEGDAPERVRATTVTASIFRVFAVPPLLGRTLQPDDERPGRANVVVLSHGLWQRRFGGDSAIIGREIRFDGEPRTVVGVMPASFAPDGYGELWMPSPFGVPPNAIRPQQDPRPVRDSNYLDVWARMKPSVTVQQAQAQMNAIAARLEKDFPDANGGVDLIVTPLQEEQVSGMRPALLLLGAAVGFLLLIGCANVANLQLARAAARTREISIRAALGASRGHIVRQLLTESVLLSLLGGALGILLAAWAIPIILATAPPALSGFATITLDRYVLAFSVAVSVLTGMLFGLAPAFQASAANPGDSLGEGERGSTASHKRSRSVLITAEVGLTLVLLMAAGLMIKSFSRLTRVDPGFMPENLLVFDIGLPPSVDDARKISFYQQVVERVRTLPGVARAAGISRLPFSGGNSSRSFNLPGSEKPYEADIRIVTPGYFRTMGIPLLRGRGFTEQDTKDGLRVAVINDSAARSLFPNEDPIGKSITNYGPDDETLQIVGVVGNVRHLALETAPRPELYQPLGQGKWPRMFIAVRSAAGNPLGLVPAVQSVVASLDRNVALGSVRTMEETIARSLVRRKFAMALLMIFAGLAVVLAAVGLYGVMSYSVAQRTREIGIRVAVGAQRGDVLLLIVRQGMMLTGAGVTLGVVMSLGLTRLMSKLLYGVSATDPVTFVSVSLLLIVVALLACWLPARRATLVDPIEALRSE